MRKKSALRPDTTLAPAGEPEEEIYGREAAPRARVLVVRAQVVGHVEPGREDPEPVRDARRAAGRGFAPGRVKKAVSKGETG